MIRDLGPEILLKSPKGLENLERVTKASKETMYGVEKGYPTHWTLLQFFYITLCFYDIKIYNL